MAQITGWSYASDRGSECQWSASRQRPCPVCGGGMRLKNRRPPCPSSSRNAELDRSRVCKNSKEVVWEPLLAVPNLPTDTPEKKHPQGSSRLATHTPGSCICGRWGTGTRFRSVHDDPVDKEKNQTKIQSESEINYALTLFPDKTISKIKKCFTK